MTRYPVTMDVKPRGEAFFDPAANTISDIVAGPASDACAIIGGTAGWRCRI